jgi:hypothetical protein
MITPARDGVVIQVVCDHHQVFCTHISFELHTKTKNNKKLKLKLNDVCVNCGPGFGFPRWEFEAVQQCFKFKASLKTLKP